MTFQQEWFGVHYDIYFKCVKLLFLVYFYQVGEISREI